MGLVLFTIDHPSRVRRFKLYLPRTAASLVVSADDGKMFASVNDHARLPSRNHFEINFNVSSHLIIVWNPATRGQSSGSWSSFYCSVESFSLFLFPFFLSLCSSRARLRVYELSDFCHGIIGLVLWEFSEWRLINCFSFFSPVGWKFGRVVNRTRKFEHARGFHGERESSRSVVTSCLKLLSQFGL